MTASSTFVAADGDGYELQMGRWSRLLAPRFIAFTEITGGARVLDASRAPTWTVKPAVPARMRQQHGS
jgi:hypothetical protein